MVDYNAVTDTKIIIYMFELYNLKIIVNKLK